MASAGQLFTTLFSGSPVLLGLATLGVLASVAAAVFAFLRVGRWRRRTRAAVPSTGIRRDRLVRIYRRFLGKQPANYRRAMIRFQPMIVLGNEGARKEEVIHHFCDWKQQAANFLESHTEAADMQLYLGSRVLIHDLSPALVEDSYRSVRNALMRLWGRLFRRRRPIAVVMVGAQALLDGDVDGLSRLATLIRGKINLLASVYRRAIETRVVVTQVDSAIAGFEQLCVFAKKCGLETRVSRHHDGTFDSFDAQLPRALVRSSARDYVSIVAFCNGYAKLTAGLKLFLDPLTSVRASGTRPDLEGIYLVGTGIGTADPFWVRDSDLEQFSDAPTRKHKRLAVALGTMLVLYQGVGFGTENTFWRRARHAVDVYGFGHEEPEPVLRAQIKAFLDIEHSVLRFLPRFMTTDAREVLRRDFSRAAEEKVIAPQVQVLREARATHLPLRALYLQALLRGTRDSALGELITNHSRDWSAITRLDEGFLDDYIVLTDDVSSLQLSVATEPQAAVGWEAWDGFVSRLAVAIEKERLEVEELRDLVHDARSLTGAAQELAEFEHIETILEALPQEDDLRRRWESSDLPSIVGWAGRGRAAEVLHRIVEEGEIAEEASATSFEQLTHRFRLIREHAHGKDFEQLVARRSDNLVQRVGTVVRAAAGAERAVGGPILFRSADWRALVRRSRVHEQIADFANNRSLGTNLLFDGAQAPSVQPRANLHFSGHPSLPGHFTAHAFQAFVEPAADGFIQELETLGSMITADDREQAKVYLQDALRLYANDYRMALEGYFQAFHAQAESERELRIVVSLMSSDASYFAEYLQIAIENACLDPLPHTYAPLTAALQDFAGLCTLKSDAAGSPAAKPETTPASPSPVAGGSPVPTNPRLAEYRAILASLSAALEHAAEATTPAADTALAERVAGAGAVALHGLTSEVSSFNTLVQNWADALPLDRRFQDPFMAPLPDVYRIGGQGLADAVRDTWLSEVEPAWDELRATYPFDPAATEDASPELIQTVLHPKEGLIAGFVATTLQAVARQTSVGQWVARKTPYGRVAIDRGTLEAVEIAQFWSERLFDSKGNPRPLRITVRALPLSKSVGLGPTPTLGFLVVGEQRVLAFNHRSTRQRLLVAWNEPFAAQVGVKIVDPSTAEQRIVGTPTVSVPASTFALLRLLDRGNFVDQRATWTLGAGYRVAFEFDEDPREQFLTGD